MGMSNNAQLVIPVVATALTVVGTIIVALINRSNKPVRDILKKTKLEGNGTLSEALGVLQEQLSQEQIRYDKQIKDSQQRHQEEIAYYVEQLRVARREIIRLREEKDLEIAELREKLQEHEDRLNSSHVGEGQ